MIVVTAIVIMMFLSTLFVLAACMGAARESRIDESTPSLNMASLWVPASREGRMEELEAASVELQ